MQSILYQIISLLLSSKTATLLLQCIINMVVLCGRHWSIETSLSFICYFPMTELVYLTLFTVLSLGLQIPSLHARRPSTVSYSGTRMLHTQHSAVQAHPGVVRQPKLPSSYQLHHLVLTPFLSREKSAVLGFRTGDLSNQSQAL
jgi:hypothetical protein